VNFPRKSYGGRAVLLLSGGIDSTVVLAWLRDFDVDVFALIFDYGQSLSKEIEIARANAEVYDAEYVILNTPLDFLKPVCSLVLSRNGLVPDIETGRNRGDITRGGMPSSYVPFRNGIFLSYAVAYAESAGIQDIYCGGNGLDSGNYPDDTIEFARAFENAARKGTGFEYCPHIKFPLAEMPKRDVVEMGDQLGVRWQDTWSCYKNGAEHCWECDSCVQRQEAMNVPCQ